MGGSNPYIEKAQVHARDEKVQGDLSSPRGQDGRSRSGKRSLRPRRPAREASWISPRDFTWDSTTPAAACAPAPRATSSCMKGWSPATNRPMPNSINWTMRRASTVKSRLGCQCVPDGTRDLVVEIPEWNKNYAKEAEHQ